MRTPRFCDKTKVRKGTWTPEEDNRLRAFVTMYGCPNWRKLPTYAGLLRCGKSCRLRWMNYLRSNIKRGSYTKEEEKTIITLHKLMGNRWSAIAAKLPGRTDNDIKNYWHSHLKKCVEDKTSTLDHETIQNSNHDKPLHLETKQEERPHQAINDLVNLETHNIMVESSSLVQLPSSEVPSMNANVEADTSTVDHFLLHQEEDVHDHVLDMEPMSAPENSYLESSHQDSSLVQLPGYEVSSTNADVEVEVHSSVDRFLHQEEVHNYVLELEQIMSAPEKSLASYLLDPTYVPYSPCFDADLFCRYSSYQQGQDDNELNRETLHNLSFW